MPNAIGEYLDRIREATSRPGHYAYRGQCDSEWALHSGATRKLIELYGPEILSSRSVRDLHLAFHRDTLLEPARARGFDIEHGRQLSDLQVLAKLQHFGASTGLLDFTWNPLVALWFACQAHDSDGKLFVVNTTNTLGIARVSSDGCDQTIEAMLCPPDNAPNLLYWEPASGGDAALRVLCQRSVFVIGRPLVLEAEGVVDSIPIKGRDKKGLIADLELLDIEESSLFQDVFGFSRAHGASSVPEEGRDSGYYLRQGNEFYQQGEYRSAVEAYGQCIALEPDTGELYFLRGNARAELGEHVDAIADYSEAIVRKGQPLLDRASTTAQITAQEIMFQVYFNRGNSRSASGDHEGAVEDYTKAIDSEARTSRTALYYNRGNAHADLRRYQCAVEDYMGMDGSTANGCFNRGNALIPLGRFEEALRQYEEAGEKGADKNRVDQNLWVARKLIGRCHGSKPAIEVGGSDTVVRIRVRFSEDQGEVEHLILVGNAGNVGNFGGRALQGGAGSQWKVADDCGYWW